MQFSSLGLIIKYEKDIHLFILSYSFPVAGCWLLVAG
jgi:hypothetical protein